VNVRLASAAAIAVSVLGTAGAALLSAGTANATPTPFPTRTVWLNSYSPTVVDGGSEVQAPFALTAGATYKIMVSGTFSAWGSWGYQRCGLPDPSAVYASPGIPNIPVGDDAIFRFAYPRYTIGGCRKVLPQHTKFFQLSLGAGWAAFTPNGGAPAEPKDGIHCYTETVTGTGTDPQFRIVDWDPMDNSGELKIEITEVSPPAV
jgi:hypothetical protein